MVLTTRMFAISIVLHCLILVSFFVEIVSSISLDVGTAATITLTLVGIMGWLKGFFSKHVDDMAYCAGAGVAGVLFTIAALWIKWAIDNPVREPPPFGLFIEDLLRRDPLWVVAPLIAIAVFASVGVLVGRRFHEWFSKERTE